MTLEDLIEIFAPATASGYSDSFKVQEGRSVTITCDVNFGSTESAAVQISHDGGATFKTYLDTTTVELSDTINALNLKGPAMYRLSKTSTASAVGLYLQR